MLNDIKNLFKKYKFIDLMENFKQHLNTNRLLGGFIMLAMNIGSRYIELKLTKGQELLLKNIAREVLIFTIAFINTKDIVLSVIITVIFIILANYLLNEESEYNILPNKYKKISIVISNDDKIVSDVEINNEY